MDSTENELDFNESAYEMYHTFDTGESCLSFSFIDSHVSSNQMQYPLTCLMVCGTQAPPEYPNYLHIMNMSGLTPFEHKSDEEDEEESEDEKSPPEMGSVSIPHEGTVNRLRTSNVFNSQFVSTFSSNSSVYLYDITDPQQTLVNQTIDKSNKNITLGKMKPFYSFNGHSTEGYALAWSSLIPGKMLSGDCSGQIFGWELSNSGNFTVEHLKYRHSDSVEDLEWSHSDPSIFASCSMDRSIRMWDIRKRGVCVDISSAHDGDVNVISLHPSEPFIVSGGDEGGLKVWDIRQADRPVAHLEWYTLPVSSVEWSRGDPSLFMAASDGSISLWDYEAVRYGIEEEDVPAELLFEHKGLKDVKEVHWWRGLHGVIGGISIEGFDIFKTISA